MTKREIELQDSHIRCLALSVLLQLKKDLVSDVKNIKRRANRFMINEDGQIKFWCDLAGIDVDEYKQAVVKVDKDFDFVEKAKEAWKAYFQ